MDFHVAVDGPILVFGGPYSNLEATRAVLAEAKRRDIPPERVICTGDVVAYCADAAACVALLRTSRAWVVMGNCEEQLAQGADDCGCGFAPGSDCDLQSAIWYAHASRTLSKADCDWMGGLPRRLGIAINGLELAVVHGSASEINRFVFPSTPARVKTHEIVDLGVDGIIAGHSGVPFTQVLDGLLWHNAGVVGMPANDGTPRGWFSILSPGDQPRSLRIEHLALDYDHQSAAVRMKQEGLPAGYAQSLSTGLWPNCDVMPPEEAGLAGVALRERLLVWNWDEPLSFDAALSGRDALRATLILPEKFRDPRTTAKGEQRASVALDALRTLWINTGTLCNLACASCYIESSPRNDRLAYISAAEVRAYLDEIARDGLPTREIGFTGGEPFMNPDMLAMLEDTLSRGLRALVLTNAMKPMHHRKPGLLALKERYGDLLTLRVSIDHYAKDLHELERGFLTWNPAIEGLRWLSENGFRIAVAGRMLSGEAEGLVRAGYGRLLAGIGVTLDPLDPAQLVLFPEMDARKDVPEITEDCWDILHKSPSDIMCSSSRMVVKRKGAEAPSVLACTLLAYDEQFELGRTLKEASRPVALNHPHCASFCVLGGGACSKV